MKCDVYLFLSLPGIIDEPGSFSGNDNSPKPQRGPDAKKRMSLAIFIRDTATEFSDPEVETKKFVVLT